MSYHLVVILVLSMSLPALSMNQRKITTQEITAIGKPFFVTFIDKKELMVASHEKAYVLDWKENEKIHETINFNPHIQNFLYDKKEKSIALMLNRSVKLYNQQTKKIGPTIEAPRPIACTFMPGNGLYVMESGKLQNTSNDAVISLPNVTLNLYDRILGHPKKECLFYIQYISKSEPVLCTIKIVGGNITFESKKLPIKPQRDDFISKLYPHAYCPINKIIAFYSTVYNTWSLYNRKNNTFIEENLKCYNLAFHPKKSLLAIITKEGFVEFRHIFNNQVIAKSDQLLANVSRYSPCWQTNIDFSEDGDQLALIIDSNYGNKCFVLSDLNQAID